VWVVLDYSHSKIVESELLLAKVSILGPEHFHELIAHHREDLEDEGERHDEGDAEVDPFARNPLVLVVLFSWFGVVGQRADCRV
jgi:hypothetical protein